MAGSERAEDIPQSGVTGRKRSIAMTEDGESGDYCRICRGESTPEQPLFHPCKCSGSIKYVHQECLMEWLSHSQKKYCELCKTSFRFTKLYDQTMPDRLPLPLFLRQLILHGGRRTARGLRYILVVFVWFCWLPWSIRQVWRGLFWLADGSWMTAQDLRYMVTAASTHNNSTTADVKVNEPFPAVLFTVDISVDSTWPWAFTATISNLLSGDALLKGLLRLIAYKPSALASLSPSLNTTSTASVASVSSGRRNSILADVQSLSFFTRYPVLNNALIDLLEGQLICLAVITAFILVFLIREWVVNQQPVHQMPDPDQAEAPAVPADQDDEGRQPGGRRRRIAVRQPQNGVLHAAGRPVNIANRPRAIPRPRRAVTDDNIGVAQVNMTGPVPHHLPARADSMQARSTSSMTTDSDMSDGAESSAPSGDVALVQDLQSPPLQRGIFDEVVDIRRHIEERPTNEPENQAEGAVDDQTSTAPEISVDASLQADHVGEPSFLTPTRLFMSESVSGQVTDDVTATEESPTSPLIELESAQQRTIEVPIIGTLMDDHEIIEDSDDESWDTVRTASEGTSSYNTSDEAALNQDEEVTMSHGVSDVAIDVPPVPPQSLVERLVEWLWDTDQYRPQQIPAPNPPIGEVLVHHAQAPFVPVNVPAAVLQPAAPAPPVPRPDIQWGIDVNEANAMDDLEDVEGVLELVGMEGPLAGMLQNFVFSVFLISLTLAAGVWCPYVWGKISLLIMSSPIGVFVKAPLFFISNVADIVIDLLLLMVGLLGYGMTSITKILRESLARYSLTSSNLFEFKTIEDLALNVTHHSSSRLEKALSGTVFHLRPDLPIFSMQSHHALRVFKGAIFEATTAISSDLLDTVTAGEQLWHSRGLLAAPLLILREVGSIPNATASAVSKCTTWFKDLSADLRMLPLDNPDTIDYSLIEWSAKDRVLAVIAGYILFLLIACAYLQIAHWAYGLKSDEKVGGIFADSLRQAGGVVKVIVIIGIEMIIFPLYCGCLLDIALLPLFRGATISGRVSFVLNAPITGVFVHWFLGTCYMFHFALFVSMCRKILRKGVLYFIRDPDDPTFHPVRDVLERPVTSQLNKIAFSAAVYGGLVIVCLGSVVWTLSNINGVFPIEWTTSEPRLAFPVDIISFNFILPFIAKRAEPSKKISSLYEWWFRKSARTLRLGQFLFGKKWNDEGPWGRLTSREAALVAQITAEKPPLKSQKKDSDNTIEGTTAQDGRWVRAPAADSVRIPKGTKVFLEVDVNNNRMDGISDKEKGLHGKSDERFIKIFIPSYFRIRICMFVFLVWLFAACMGATFTIIPLLLGRGLIRLLTGIEKAPNDLYAFTVGMHLCAAMIYLSMVAKKQQARLRARGPSMFLNFRENVTQVYQSLKYISGLLYIAAAFGIVIPALLSLLAELYIHMPIYSYVSSTITLSPSEPRSTPREVSTIGSIPTIYLIQAWTLGILYLRILLRIVTNYPNPGARAATAIKAIIQNGILHPNIRLATRAFILPTITTTITLLLIPLLLAKLLILISNTTDATLSTTIYRSSYPILLTVSISIYMLSRIHAKLEGWQIKVRDEVYLVGERLHNFADSPPSTTTESKDVDVKTNMNLTKDALEMIQNTAAEDTGAGMNEVSAENQSVNVIETNPASMEPGPSGSGDRESDGINW